jgi:hypothetical protein
MAGPRSATRTRHSPERSSIVTRCLAANPRPPVTTHHLPSPLTASISLPAVAVARIRGGYKEGGRHTTARLRRAPESGGGLCSPRSDLWLFRCQRLSIQWVRLVIGWFIFDISQHMSQGSAPAWPPFKVLVPLFLRTL